VKASQISRPRLGVGPEDQLGRVTGSEHAVLKLGERLDESGFEGMATMRGRSQWMATPVPYRGRVARVSRSLDCQLEVVPVDLDLT
jgi:hypothetical protein